MEWLIVLAVLSLVLLMPCGVYARYCSTGMAAKLIVGPFRVNLIRSGKKKRKKKSGKPASAKKSANKQPQKDFWPVVRLVLDLLSDFRRKLIIKDLQFKLILGGNDPYDLSVNYGRYWAVFGSLVPHLHSWFRIRNCNLEIECDYLAEKTKVDTAIDLRLTLFTLLRMVLHHGIRILIKYYKISKEAKEGAVS